ncbi:hypothetical protein U5801_21230 [Lamprobacter modestohalophilus]|uniref:hypothetical protein n=1 Tax=Lamprobacter modestohalophilus TaxID=1064514 RepID=UPI002ADEE0EA|nr:hypothetical protein [Lamprobacter modestohalophilus]MEA1052307.1 hypothetical protein [Lamprobacter modestohalophilus]
MVDKATRGLAAHQLTLQMEAETNASAELDRKPDQALRQPPYRRSRRQAAPAIDER